MAKTYLILLALLFGCQSKKVEQNTADYKKASVTLYRLMYSVDNAADSVTATEITPISKAHFDSLQSFLTKRYAINEDGEVPNYTGMQEVLYTVDSFHSNTPNEGQKDFRLVLANVYSSEEDYAMYFVLNDSLTRLHPF